MRNLPEIAAIFDEIYELYADDMYRLCFTYMKNKMDAEDAVQETFSRLYTTRQKFDSREHIKAWLIVTASNYCKDILKQWWRKRKNLDEIGEIASEEKMENSKITDNSEHPAENDDSIWKKSRVALSAPIIYAYLSQCRNCENCKYDCKGKDNKDLANEEQIRGPCVPVDLTKLGKEIVLL